MNSQQKKLRILFLCTGNSCRSQMAEGWARHLKSGEIEPSSAGTEPQGVNPLAVQVMKEVGVDISGQRSKHVMELLDQPFDYVVTLCGGAREACPVFSSNTKLRHVGFEDPAVATGNNEQILSVFRKVRDQIRHFVETLPDSLEHEKERK
jgi:arsenate reductase